jgi:multisubunit Na+/H+ antiporter MnhB subunit
VIHAIVLGFGFVAGGLLFVICIRLIAAAVIIANMPKRPKVPRPADDDWDDWRGALVVIGVLVCIAVVAALMPYQPRQKTASHGMTSTGLTWKQIAP